MKCRSQHHRQTCPRVNSDPTGAGKACWESSLGAVGPAALPCGHLPQGEPGGSRGLAAMALMVSRHLCPSQHAPPAPGL